MRVIRSLAQMTSLARRWRARGDTVGFVPTMGAFHEGHLSLMRRARRDNDRVVVSIFVNPLQFGPREDFARYPRPFARDVGLARAAGVDVVFAPSVAAMYPPNHVTIVEVRGLTDGLCGRFRPSHFRGVATVVAKLFALVQPSTAYVGQKDAQQAAVIRRMVSDLHLPIAVRVLPTVRERDGLAMSSRNVYLTALQRRQALRLSQALQMARRMIRSGERHPAAIRRRMLALLRRGGGVRVDYVELVDTEELQPVQRLRGRVLIAVAGWVGRTRLIDNLVVSV